MNRTKTIVLCGFLIALQIIFTRFFSIHTATLRIGIGFLPIAIASIIFGPLIGGVIAVISDFLRMMILPEGVYFPGFTLSAFLTGYIYGLFLNKKRSLSILNICLSVLLITLVVDIGLNTYWLTILTSKSGVNLIFPRILKSVIMFPIQVTLIYIAQKFFYNNYSKLIR